MRYTLFILLAFVGCRSVGNYGERLEREKVSLVREALDDLTNVEAEQFVTTNLNSETVDDLIGELSDSDLRVQNKVLGILMRTPGRERMDWRAAERVTARLSNYINQAQPFREKAISARLLWDPSTPTTQTAMDVLGVKNPEEILQLPGGYNAHKSYENWIEGILQLLMIDQKGAVMQTVRFILSIKRDIKWVKANL